MRDEWLAFLDNPNRETYLAVRDRLIASDFYEPYSTETRTADELYQQNDFAGAIAALRVPNLLLSPRAHQFLAFLQSKQGDAEAERLEQTIAAACVRGLLATGDGSPERPYVVCRVSDEYDVLECLKKTMERQSLVPQHDRHFDVIRCQDGEEYWFDVTDVFQAQSRSR